MNAFNPIIKKSLLSLLQGFVEKNETLLTSVRRELCEERGIDKKKYQLFIRKKFISSAV